MLTFCLAALSLLGCSAATWQGLAEGLAAAGSNTPVLTNYGTKLMVFGGSGHDTYLGCLSCSEYEAESLFNTYGRFGSRYSSTSVLNSYSQFGSKYSAYSACNPYATDPPVIVDQNGKFYGRLTLNRYNTQRINHEQLLSWLAGVCQS